MSSKTFPPKFNKNILYPAELNLDELDFSNSNPYNSENNTGIIGDNSFLGDYIDIEFPGYAGINQSPTLGFGKHLFYITIKPDPGGIGSGFPLLKQNSTILFEVKDALDSLGRRRVVFSDSTPIYSNGILKFAAYVWIKQDPLRTHDSIQDGAGYISIVAIHETEDSFWNNRFNLRNQLPIIIDTVNSDNTFKPNYSPIIFKNPDLMKSGSGLTIKEKLTDNQNVEEISLLEITSSNLETYSGNIDSIITEFWLSGSSTDWKVLTGGNHSLVGTTYEDEIDKNYAYGINPKIEEWTQEIAASDISLTNQTNLVKFRLSFLNSPTGIFALNEIPFSSSNDIDINNKFTLIYPEGNPLDTNYTNSDSNWLTLQGAPNLLNGSLVFENAGNQVVIQTGAGEFNFGPASLDSGVGSNYDSDGNPSTVLDKLSPPNITK
jgi:hypothetical protein